MRLLVNYQAFRVSPVSSGRCLGPYSGMWHSVSESGKTVYMGLSDAPRGYRANGPLHRHAQGLRASQILLRDRPEKRPLAEAERP